MTTLQVQVLHAVTVFPARIKGTVVLKLAHSRSLPRAGPLKGGAHSSDGRSSDALWQGDCEPSHIEAPLLLSRGAPALRWGEDKENILYKPRHGDH